MPVTSLPPPRRIVTGLDPQGRSCITHDDHAQTVVWASDTSPADNAEPAQGKSWALSMLDGGKLRFGPYQDFATGRVVDTTNAVLTAGQWHHVAGTFDQAMIPPSFFHLLERSCNRCVRPEHRAISRSQSIFYTKDRNRPALLSGRQVHAFLLREHGEKRSGIEPA